MSDFLLQQDGKELSIIYPLTPTYRLFIALQVSLEKPSCSPLSSGAQNFMGLPPAGKGGRELSTSPKLPNSVPGYCSLDILEQQPCGNG